jgi:hypothetical protein
MPNEIFLSSDEIQAAVQRVQTRAATDVDFRALCLADPVAAAKEEAGVDVPADFTINVVDNNNADLTVVLPDFVDGAGEELSDADLEAVAGGVASRCMDSCQGSSGIC